jgi:hypothetical protein
MRKWCCIGKYEEILKIGERSVAMPSGVFAATEALA